MSKRKSLEELYPGTKPLSEAAVGDDLGSLEFVITTEMVERIAWACDDYNPWYMDDEESPFGHRIPSPVAVASFDAQLFYGYYKYPEGGSLFAKEEFAYHRPLRLDTPYRLSGRLEQIYERKGRTFYRVAMVVHDMDGNEMMHVWKTVASPVNPVLLAEVTGQDTAGQEKRVS